MSKSNLFIVVHKGTKVVNLAKFQFVRYRVDELSGRYHRPRATQKQSFQHSSDGGRRAKIEFTDRSYRKSSLPKLFGLWPTLSSVIIECVVASSDWPSTVAIGRFRLVANEKKSIRETLERPLWIGQARRIASSMYTASIVASVRPYAGLFHPHRQRRRRETLGVRRPTLSWPRRSCRSSPPRGRPLVDGSSFVRLTDAEKWSSRPSTPERSRRSLFETNYSTSGRDGQNVHSPPARRLSCCAVDRCRLDGTVLRSR